MTDHLTTSVLNALADGELSAEQLGAAEAHLAGCGPCALSALHQSLLKSAAAKAGHRYAPSPHLQERLTGLAFQEASQPLKLGARGAQRSPQRSTGRWASLGLAAAAILLLASVSMMIVQHNTRRADIASAEQVAQVTEVFDQHLATLAGSLSPQVISTDRHTVKPWFQGKIPFSFNLPENLPKDTTLDGANLTYMRSQPVAQLLYSIGKHRISVFVQEKASAAGASQSQAEHAGFHVMEFHTDNLEMVAISDVDSARLAELVRAIRQAQATGDK
jgi:anti-sigma factor RsiW